MRRLMVWVSTMCLGCLAGILLLWTGSRVIAGITHTGQANLPDTLVRVREHHEYYVPDHQLAVFESVVDTSYEIFVADSLTGETRQLTSHVANDRFPILSPDGKRVAFVSWRDGNSEIYVVDLATGSLQNLSNHAGHDMLLESAWSPDGTMLAFVSQLQDNLDIRIADVMRGLSHNLTHSPYHDTQPVWMRDSQRLIVTSNRDGSPAQYVIDVGGRILTQYPAGNRWQAVQNPVTLETPLDTMSG